MPDMLAYEVMSVSVRYARSNNRVPLKMNSHIFI